MDDIEVASREYKELNSSASSIELSERIFRNNPSKLREEEHSKKIEEYHESVKTSHVNIKKKYGVFNKYNKNFRKLKRHAKAKRIVFQRCVYQKYLSPLGSYFTGNPQLSKPILRNVLESNLD